jgi:hypothetical protein
MQSMKVIIKNLKILAQISLNLLVSLQQFFLLGVSINWSESLAPLRDLLSQDIASEESQPEIEAAFKGKLAGEKRMYRDHIKMRMPFH